MPINQYFQNTLQGGISNNEFSLLQDLNIEATKMFGFVVKYLPRTLRKEDDIFGEDILSQFSEAADIEMYIKDTDGFGGEGDFLSRFGLEIRDTINFSVPVKRFAQFQDEKVMNEVGFNLLIEDGNEILLEDSSGTGYSLSLARPFEGDLIFFPLTNKLYEVKFVEHEETFYQLGRLYTYELRCELLSYTSERLDTGVVAIDSIETAFSTDMLDNQVLMEANTLVLLEDGASTIILETERLEDNMPSANNEAFDLEEKASDIINSSESSPFGSYTF